MEKKETEYTIIYDPRPWIQRFVGISVFYAFLGLMVWLSLGSVWWTFFFGSFSLFALWARVVVILMETQSKFHDKSELLEFVKSLPDRD